jgi:hypothetical protein
MYIHDVKAMEFEPPNSTAFDGSSMIPLSIGVTAYSRTLVLVVESDAQRTISLPASPNPTETPPSITNSKKKETQLYRPLDYRL